MSRTIPNVDDLVGARVRLRRMELEMSQSGLSKKLGLSFQQLQKYEKATNRISAGVLYEISKALAVPIGYFFEDCEADSKAKGRGKASKRA